MIPILLLALVALTLIIERLIFFTRNRIWSNERIPQLMKEISEKSEYEVSRGPGRRAPKRLPALYQQHGARHGLSFRTSAISPPSWDSWAP